MNTRQRIVDTASRLFYRQGYNGTGINQVIKEAEIAKASLYQYFPSKEDLLVEYLKTTADTTEKMLKTELDKHKKPKEKILSLFDFLARFAKQTDFNGCNFLNVASELPANDQKVRNLIRKQKNSVRNLIADILKPVGKEDLADEIYLLFDAALISSKVHGDLWPVKTARRVVEKLI